MVLESEGLFWLGLALAFVLVVVLGLLLALVAHGALVRARSRGYPGRPVGAAIAVAVVAPVAGVGVPMFRSPRWEEPSPPTDLFPMVALVLLVLPAAVASLTCWLVCRSLPPRMNRRPGVRPRRHDYLRWSRFASVAVVVAVPFAWQDGLDTLVRLLVVGSGICLGLRRLERRHTSQDEALPDAGEPYVLYLRPFATENRAAYRLPDADAEFTGQGLRKWVTLDEYLAAAARARFGRFVALGNPSEPLPPLGASRVYLDDGSWQDELKRVADGATAFVMAPVRDTESLRFELEYLAAEGLQERLFVVTPSRMRSPMRRITRFMDALYGWETVTWPAFAEGLSAATGWRVPVDDPGPSAVVTFDHGGNAEVLAQEVATPSTVVDLIGTRLRRVEVDRT